MKKIFTLMMATAIIIALSASCTSASKYEPEMPAPETENVNYLQLPLQVDADCTKAVFTIYDDAFVAVYSGEKVIPENGEVTLDFLAEDEPKYLGVPGLANGDPETGLLNIGGKQVQTKASERILVVIR